MRVRKNEEWVLKKSYIGLENTSLMVCKVTEKCECQEAPF